MVPSDIQKLIQLAKAEGVKSLKVGDIQIDLFPQLPDGPGLNEAELAKALAGPADDPEEILFHSVGGAGKEAPGGGDLVPPLMGLEVPGAN